MYVENIRIIYFCFLNTEHLKKNGRKKKKKNEGLENKFCSRGK